MMTTAFAAVNTFLLAAGLDVGASAAVELYEVSRLAVRECWRSNSLPLHAALQLNANIHLRLDHLQVRLTPCAALRCAEATCHEACASCRMLTRTIPRTVICRCA